MTTERVRRLVGPALLIVTVVAGGTLLELTVDVTAEEWTVRAFLVLGLVAVAAYVLLVYLPQRRTERELESLRRQQSEHRESLRTLLEELRQGDLVESARPARALPPEVVDSVVAATRSLAAQVQQIQSSSVDVATSASTVHETAAELASGSSEQAAAVVEITATMEELARTAGQIATNAARQAELAGRSEATGDDGASALEQAMAGLEAVRVHMDAIANRSDVLGNRSRQIYRVLDLIKEISHETHILSLNAAIEASAAGEHGERFAVVAEEVRRLAERSRESVESVRGLLDEFSGAIRSVVVATEEGSKAVDEVLGRSRATSGVIDELRDALAATAQAAREISLATEEQRTASNEVVLTLKEVSSVIQRVADGLKQFTGAADRLNQVALTIQLLTQSFRIDSSHSLKHRAVAWSGRLADAAGSLEAVEGVLHELLEDSPWVELLYLVDEHGVMAAFALNHDLVPDGEAGRTVTVGQDYSDRPWFLAVARDRRTVVTPLYESLLTGERCFTLATPVEGPGGRVAGVLGADVNVRNWTRI